MQVRKVKCPKCGCKIPFTEALAHELAKVRAHVAEYSRLKQALRRERRELSRLDLGLHQQKFDLKIALQAEAERKQAWEKAAAMTTNQCQIMLREKDLQLDAMRAHILELNQRKPRTLSV